MIVVDPFQLKSPPLPSFFLLSLLKEDGAKDRAGGEASGHGPRSSQEAGPDTSYRVQPGDELPTA